MPKILTDEEVAEFRDRLCAVAERRFAEDGVAAASIRAIADELGVSRMTPYRYVADKDELLAMVRTRAFARLSEALVDAAATTDHPGARLEALGRAYVRFAATEPHAYRLMYELDQEDEQRYPALVEEIQRSHVPLVEAVRTAADAGLVVGDPLDAAHVLWAGLHGLNSLALSDKLQLGRDVDELTDVMIAALSRAIARRTR